MTAPVDTVTAERLRDGLRCVDCDAWATKRCVRCEGAVWCDAHVVQPTADERGCGCEIVPVGAGGDVR